MFKPLHAEADAPTRGAFRLDSRFRAKAAADMPAVPSGRGDDPLSDAWDEGYRAAAAQMREDKARDAAAVAQLELASTRITESDVAALAEKLRETVIALCGAVLDGAAIDPELLSRRITSALALLRRSTDDQVLRLHPDDLALVGDRLAPGLAVRADPGLERGALRIETAAGGVEDGPAQWRDAIAAAVRSC